MTGVQTCALPIFKRVAGADQASGPPALNNLSIGADRVVWIGALVAAGNGKIVDVVEASYALPAGLFTEFGRIAYERGVKYAEQGESSVIQAVKAYATELKVASPHSDRARQHFWTRVEQHLDALFDVARKLTPPDQFTASDWGQCVRAAAADAYEQTCPRQTPRQIQAFALGLRRLHSTAKANSKSVITKSKTHE